MALAANRSRAAHYSHHAPENLRYLPRTDRTTREGTGLETLGNDEASASLPAIAPQRKIRCFGGGGGFSVL
jgi:hypothetical protein